MTANYEDQKQLNLVTTEGLITAFNAEAEEPLSLEPSALDSSMIAFNGYMEQAGLIKWIVTANKPKDMQITPVGKQMCYMKSYRFKVTGQVIELAFWDADAVVPLVIKAIAG